MQLVTEKDDWRLEGKYDQSSLLKIKQSLQGAKRQSNGTLDLTNLVSMNAPIIALMIEIRRQSDSMTLKGCREEFREMLKLYGVECIFQFA